MDSTRNGNDSARQLYGGDFFGDHHDSAATSAASVVPWIIELIAPRSVLDVGCGTGSWLAVFRRHGIENTFGVDGDWVAPEQLEIPKENFQVADLRQVASEPYHQCDLALCLEVAEHLPEASADRLVSQLTCCAPVVLFSAAIPGQGGTGHINEQWPDYWSNLFDRNGFQCVDCLRGRFWDAAGVARWYVQNAFFFVARTQVDRFSSLLREERAYPLGHKRVVHPRSYACKVQDIERLSNPENYSILQFLQASPRILKRAIRRRFLASHIR